MADTALRRIEVSDHAVSQYRERIRPHEKGNKYIRTTIQGLVRCGLEAGNSLTSKPEGFRLYGETRKGSRLPAGQRFVWCEDEPRVGFVVLREPGEPDFVKTTLVRVGVSR